MYGTFASAAPGGGCTNTVNTNIPGLGAGARFVEGIATSTTTTCTGSSETTWAAVVGAYQGTGGCVPFVYVYPCVFIPAFLPSPIFTSYFWLNNDS
jgi:hypothetical protein